ncbi:MAG: hypothetical protein ACI9U2_001157 [Bradymonadia bacterium]|jgi:hypothetical protein
MDGLRLTTLIHRALDGNKGALRLLARRMLPVINARVRQQVRRRGGADDFEIDTMVQTLWTHCLADPRLRTLEDSSLDLPDLTLTMCDAQMTLVLGDVPPPAPEPARDDALDPLWTHLRAQLNPSALLAFRLMYTDGRSPRTVARLLQVDEPQVLEWQTQMRAVAESWSAAQGESA